MLMRWSPRQGLIAGPAFIIEQALGYDLTAASSHAPRLQSKLYIIPGQR